MWICFFISIPQTLLAQTLDEEIFCSCVLKGISHRLKKQSLTMWTVYTILRYQHQSHNSRRNNSSAAHTAKQSYLFCHLYRQTFVDSLFLLTHSGQKKTKCFFFSRIGMDFIPVCTEYLIKTDFFGSWLVVLCRIIIEFCSLIIF